MSGGKITQEERIKLHEVIFEVKRVGKMVRVVAVDPITGVEVTTIAPFNVGKTNWQRLAQRKLEYVLTKKLHAKNEKKGRGFIV